MIEAGIHCTLYVALIYIWKTLFILFIPYNVWPRNWMVGPLCDGGGGGGSDRVMAAAAYLGGLGT